MTKRKTSVHDEYIRAGSTNATADELAKLAISEIVVVRQRVAENERTPKETLLLLSRDSAPDVRIAVALNISTDAEIVVQIACDECEDVRYFLASTSYTPKHCLLRLADDKNPHVAHRAKQMLFALEGKADKRAASVFGVLAHDHVKLEEQLKSLLEKPANYDKEMLFLDSVEALDGIRRHLERQRRMCTEWIESHVPVPGDLKICLEASATDQQRMIDTVVDLLMSVDGSEYADKLKLLLKQLSEHASFTESKLFPEIKKHLSPDELALMNQGVHQIDDR
ncbi:MAG: hypothetical protein HC888_02135 [Candidatus Competibacteraceae bacterium]|nr:hypothetical protein [Candidatus Competibacteraceae bacterium]